MARTKGSISIVSIPFKDLINLLGDEYNGDVGISLKWLESVHGKKGYRVVLDDGVDKLDIQVSPKKVEERDAKPKFRVI